MNEKINAFLKDLSPELQEKAKDIKTQEELLKFLSDNDVELPEDALEAVSGGCRVENDYPAGTVFKGECPCCGGDLIYHDNKCCHFVDGGYHEWVNTYRAHCAKTRVLYVRRNLDLGRHKWEVYQSDM